ncbi:MAG: 1-acyl-sn-glycerol-3-phosphate acyltransferase [Crocinitomicaceae bacterium]|nr:1-acyl-sn-glycerol-3-phosphate acyltransferase [Crocinitomicaceae bacterium]|tara:strand:- start:22524 stop:23285 length:762 start_codon:yes stop_codon:yes gene_type:complete
MALFKKDAFGNRLIIKRILILLFGSVAFYRFLRVNTTKVTGWEVLHKLPKTNVLFVSNHQTYFMDVFLLYIAISAARNGQSNLKPLWYILNPVLNFYYVAAIETMKGGLLPKLMAKTGAVMIKRTWREKGKEINRKVSMKDLTNIFTALGEGWVVTFPQGTTKPYAKGRKGTAHIIKQTRPVVVPVNLDGFRKAFNKSGMKMKMKGTELTVHFKEPMDIDYDKPAEEILEDIMVEIKQSEDFKPDLSRELVKN